MLCATSCLSPAKRAYDLTLSTSLQALTSNASEPHAFDMGDFVMYLLVHLGRTAAAHTRHRYTKAAKRLRYTGGVFT